MSCQPESYEKKALYRFGRTLGAGTYGVVREAVRNSDESSVAVKIILKKNVRGNESMVEDELKLLQNLSHPHIVKFIDYFESRDKYYIVTELATGGELFDRICEQGRFTEKDASQTIRQVLDAVKYLHDKNIVHRDLKPENLLYRTREAHSDLVLADFGIAKMLDRKEEVLKTMAGSFGYAAPEVMQKQGHGKPVDMWSLGVITYTLLCGYSPFRSENLSDLIEECTNSPVVFHERYWKDVSNDAKEFIRTLLQPDPKARATSEEALKHHWLTGQSASDHDLLPEIRSYIARSRFRRGVDLVKLSNRIAALRQQADEDEDLDFVDNEDEEGGDAQRPADGVDGAAPTGESQQQQQQPQQPRRLSKIAKGAIFREVVLAKVREQKEQEKAQTEVEEARRQSGL